jgi:hypothetical protein
LKISNDVTSEYGHWKIAQEVSTISIIHSKEPSIQIQKRIYTREVTKEVPLGS